MEWYLQVIRKYASFEGRASRQEYWMFILVNLIITIVISTVESIIDVTISSDGIGAIAIIYMLFILLPSISVGVRRLHDTGRSGAWFLVLFLPFVGGILYLIFMVLDSHNQNEYGPSPKGVDPRRQKTAPVQSSAEVVNRANRQQLNKPDLGALDATQLAPTSSRSKVFSVAVGEYQYTVELDSTPLIFGRADTSAPEEVQAIWAADPFMSRQHCQLWYDSSLQQLNIKCLSNNGMTIDSSALLRDERMEITIFQPVSLIIGNTTVLLLEV